VQKYFASGIVVFNLDTRQVKWTADLDLSTDTVNFRAHVYSSPTVVDLDGDGYLDILVGTGYGLFYVIDHRGKFLSHNINGSQKQLCSELVTYFSYILYRSSSQIIAFSTRIVIFIVVVTNTGV